MSQYPRAAMAALTGMGLLSQNRARIRGIYLHWSWAAPATSPAKNRWVMATVSAGITLDSTEMQPAPPMDRMGPIWSSLPEKMSSRSPIRETVDVLESEAGAQGTFLNDLVMEEILGELRDIGRRGGISCTCGCREWKLKINYSSVELFCAQCGGALKLPAATMSDIEDLCCKPTLTIRGGKPPEDAK